MKKKKNYFLRPKNFRQRLFCHIFFGVAIILSLIDSRLSDCKTSHGSYRKSVIYGVINYNTVRRRKKIGKKRQSWKDSRERSLLIVLPNPALETTRWERL